MRFKKIFSTSQLVSGLGFFVNYILLQGLGEVAFGQYSSSIAFVTLIYSFVDVKSTDVFAPLYSENLKNDKLKFIIGANLRVDLIIALVSVLFFFIGARLVYLELSLEVYFYALTLAISMALRFVKTLAVVCGELNLLRGQMLSQRATLSIIILGLYFMNMIKVDLALLALSLSQFLYIIYSLNVWNKLRKKYTLTISFGPFNTVINRSKIFSNYLILSSRQVYESVPIVLLGNFGFDILAGKYRLLFSFLSIIRTLETGLVNSNYTKISSTGNIEVLLREGRKTKHLWLTFTLLTASLMLVYSVFLNFSKPIDYVLMLSYAAVALVQLANYAVVPVLYVRGLINFYLKVTLAITSIMLLAISWLVTKGNIVGVVSVITFLLIVQTYILRRRLI